MARGGRALPVVVLGLLLALFAASTPAAQAAPAKTTVRAELRPPRIQIGQSTVAFATVGPAGRRGTAELQTYFDGRWQAVKDGRKPVASNNTVGFRIAPKFVGRYRFRIVALPTARHARGVSVTLTLDVVRKAVRVSAAARPSTVKAGQPTTVVGTPSPARAGASVSLQQLVGSTWRTVTSGRVSGSNSISLSHRPATTGQFRYRLVVAGDTVHAVGASPAAVVTVQPPPYTGATVEDGASGHTVNGSWTPQSSGSGGRSLLIASVCSGSSSSDGIGSSTWTTALQPGRFRVEAYVPPGAQEFVQYQISTPGGIVRSEYRQVTVAGTWVVLADDVALGDSGRVHLDALGVESPCTPNDSVGADAVRWVYLGAS